MFPQAIVSPRLGSASNRCVPRKQRYTMHTLVNIVLVQNILHLFRNINFSRVRSAKHQERIRITADLELHKTCRNSFFVALHLDKSRRVISQALIQHQRSASSAKYRKGERQGCGHASSREILSISIEYSRTASCTHNDLTVMCLRPPQTRLNMMARHALASTR